MTFKLNELSWEVPLQLGLQITMLLLATSSSVTHSGMQALFQEEFQDDTDMDWSLPKTLFLLSIIWSFRTCSATYVKIRQEEKVNFLPFPTKLILGTRGFFVCLVLRTRKLPRPLGSRGQVFEPEHDVQSELDQ